MSRKPIDWEAIEKEYRAGQVSISEIARLHDVSRQAIIKRAKREKWTRDLSEEVRREAASRLLVTPEFTPANAREAVDAAARRVVEVVTSHRRDLAQLHGLKRILATRLAAHLHGEHPEGPFMGDKESPADVLEKLARTTARLIPLERQAFSLDKDLPEDPATNRDLAQALAKLDKQNRDNLRAVAQALSE